MFYNKKAKCTVTITLEDLFYVSEEEKERIEEERNELKSLDDLFYGGVSISAISTNNEHYSVNDIFINNDNKEKKNKEGVKERLHTLFEQGYNFKEIRKDVEPDYRRISIIEILNACETYLKYYGDSNDVDKQLSVSLCKSLKKILPSYDPYSVIAQHSFLLYRFRTLYKEHPEYEILRMIVKY